MTREEELAALAECLVFAGGLQALPPEEQHRLVEEVVGRLPVDVADQQAAAAAEVQDAFPSLGRAVLGLAADEGTESSFVAGDIGTAIMSGYLLAAVTRCMATYSCDHALRGERPLRAILAPRIISCDECLPTFASQLLLQTSRVADDNECDLCLKRDVTHFIPFSTVFGPVIVIGDACAACSALGAS